jgi:hypothetical protein
MKNNDIKPLDLNLVPTVANAELKDRELERVASGKELGQFIPNMGSMSFPSIKIPSFGT